MIELEIRRVQLSGLMIMCSMISFALGNNQEDKVDDSLYTAGSKKQVTREKTLLTNILQLKSLSLLASAELTLEEWRMLCSLTGVLIIMMIVDDRPTWMKRDICSRYFNCREFEYWSTQVWTHIQYIHTTLLVINVLTLTFREIAIVSSYYALCIALLHICWWKFLL